MAAAVESERPWQLNTRSAEAGFAYVWRNQVLTDLSCIVGPEKREFKAHRLFVAARCPQLLNIASKDCDVFPPMTKIYLPDVSPDAFEILLNYINTSVINEMDSQDLVLDVYLAANTYGLEKLQEECQKLIKKWDINCENVISMLQMTDVDLIRDRCWEFLQTHAWNGMESIHMVTASPKTLTRIFEKGYFTGISTMQLLTRIMAWAERQYKFVENKKTGQKSYKEVRNNLLIPHGDASKCLMSWIGFQNLSPKELTQACTMYPELLTVEEFGMFVMYGCTEGEKPALPNWA